MSSPHSSGRGARPGNTNAASHSYHLRSALVDLGSIEREAQLIEADAVQIQVRSRAVRRMCTEARLAIQEGDEVAAKRISRQQAELSVLRTRGPGGHPAMAEVA